MSMVLKKFKSRFESYELVSHRDGRFEISVDGKLLYSRLQTRKFPDPTKIVALLEAELAAAE